MKLQLKFVFIWLWVFFMFGCGAVPCQQAQVAIWKDVNEKTHKYKITVRCHGDEGYQDVDVVKSKSKITGCGGN